MRQFAAIFRHELTGLIRSNTAIGLLIAAVAWMVAMPYVIKSDGTLAGERELYLHYSLGGVFLLTVIVSMACATATLARERVAKRLQLTLIRPIRYSLIVLAKVLAQTALGAVVLAVSAAMVFVRVRDHGVCCHVLKPLLPSPREEAKAMYASYMADPETPKSVKSAPKRAVMRLLENRAFDHYQTVATNDMVEWRFDRQFLNASIAAPSVRMRFTNPMELRQEFRGEFTLNGCSAMVSNMTQSVLCEPLRGVIDANEGGEAVLKFRNLGAYGVMLRPRRDIELLVAADGFGWNLLRAVIELVAVLMLLVAFATLLSAALGRPVAMFTAMAFLILSEISPGVVEQYPDELDANLVDRIGLQITRLAAEVTRPVSAIAPLASLAKDECVESREVWRVLALDAVLMPIVLALLSALIIPRKPE